MPEKTVCEVINDLYKKFLTEANNYKQVSQQAKGTIWHGAELEKQNRLNIFLDEIKSRVAQIRENRTFAQRIVYGRPYVDVKVFGYPSRTSVISIYRISDAEYDWLRKSTDLMISYDNYTQIAKIESQWSA